MRRPSRPFFLILIPALLLAGAGIATAAVVNINDTNLVGGNATWDPDPSTDACVSLLQPAYSPANDAQIGIHTDAFDGGLVLIESKGPFAVNGFRGGQTANKTGQQLTVGPKSFAGMKVTRIDRAMSSDSLRSLVKLQNKKKKPQTAILGLDSELGSDSNTGVRRTSNGSKFTKASRWVVTSDNATTPNDPVVTHVFYGSGNPRVKVASLPYGPAGPDNDCVTVAFSKVVVPAKSTRYLLFFASLNDTNPSAITTAKGFNNRKLDSAKLNGLSKSVKKNILNWDF